MRYGGSKPGEEQSDNELAMRFCWCPPGSFFMGTPQESPHEIEQKYRMKEETPVTVMIGRGFWLGKCEVSQREWMSLFGTRPWIGHEYSFYVVENPEHPAAFISWHDASNFCLTMTEREREAGRLPPGWEYLLPTEAQWEYACRAGTRTPYSFGGSPSLMPDYEWFAENAFDVGERYAHPVGTKRANPWGLHDMHGNMSEWCRDWYVEALPGGTDPEVVEGGTDRVFRGCSWADPAWEGRSASRHHYQPHRRNYVLGFRAAIVCVGGTA